MKTKKMKYGLILLSVTILFAGDLTLWLLFFPILDKLGGINVLSLSVVTLFFSVFLLSYVYIFRYAQGKLIRRWQMVIIQTYVGLTILIGLGFIYDSLLPDNVLFIWPYGILPLATMLIAFHLLRKIPKIREKLDQLSKDW